MAIKLVDRILDVIFVTYVLYQSVSLQSVTRQYRIEKLTRIRSKISNGINLNNYVIKLGSFLATKSETKCVWSFYLRQGFNKCYT